MATRLIFLPLIVGRVDFETNKRSVLHAESNINVAQYKFRVDLLHKISLNPIIISIKKINQQQSTTYLFSTLRTGIRLRLHRVETTVLKDKERSNSLNRMPVAVVPLGSLQTRGLGQNFLSVLT